MLSYGTNAAADYRIEGLIMSSGGSEFDLVLSEKTCGKHDGACNHIKTNIVAEYNILNLTAAIAGLSLSRL